MSLFLKNESQRRDGRSWKWWIWLDALAAELDQIREVRYRLHPSFVVTDYVVTERANGFRLQKSGWGEFAIHAVAVNHDGSETRLQHWLTLEGCEHGRGRPEVFISHAAADAPFAAALEAELMRANVIVARADTAVASGRPVAEEIRGAIEEARVGLVICSDNAGSYVVQETRALVDNGAVVIPVSLSRASDELEGLLQDYQGIKVEYGSGEQSAYTVAKDAVKFMKIQGVL